MEKLNKKTFLPLQNLSLDEKIQTLSVWEKNQKISSSTRNEMILKFLLRETNQKFPIRTTEGVKAKSVYDGQAINFRNHLLKVVKKEASLDENDVARFRSCLESTSRNVRNQLLCTALHVDKLSDIATDVILSEKVSPLTCDETFFRLLWQEPIVALAAIKVSKVAITRNDRLRNKISDLIKTHYCRTEYVLDVLNNHHLTGLLPFSGEYIQEILKLVCI